MSCGAHVEGILRCANKAGKRAGTHHSVNSLMISSLPVRPTSAAPSVSTVTGCFIKTTYSATAWKPAGGDLRHSAWRSHSAGLRAT